MHAIFSLYVSKHLRRVWAASRPARVCVCIIMCASIRKCECIKSEGRCMPFSPCTCEQALEEEVGGTLHERKHTHINIKLTVWTLNMCACLRVCASN